MPGRLYYIKLDSGTYLQYGTQMYIKNAKSQQTVQFSPDGKYLALVERTDCNDYINVFHTSTWKFVSQFKVPTINAAGLLWVRK